MTRLAPAAGTPPRRTAAGRALLSAAACLTLLTGATACGAGFDAQTQEFYSPGDGVNAVVGHMRVLNVLVVAPGEEGQEAVLSMAIANDSTAPEEVRQILTDDYGPVRIVGDRTIPARGSVLYGGQASQNRATLPGFTGKPGETVTLRFEFARNEPIESLETVVVPPTGYFADLRIRPEPSTAVSPQPEFPAGSPAVTAPSAPAGVGGAEPNEEIGEDAPAPADPATR